MQFYFKNNGHLFLILLLLLSRPSPVQALPPGVDFEIKGDLLSVDLSDASLMDILNKLKTTKGIWFKAEPSQLGERVSARFQGLPLERGLQRILASQDYCLYFDTTGKLIGINLIKKDMKEVQRGASFRPPEPSRNMPFTPPLPPSVPPASTGPLYIPKPNPPVPTRVPAPTRVTKPPGNNPFEPNPLPEQPASRNIVKPVPQPPKPPLPMLPEPPNEEDQDNE
jgi:hypothetical protein